MGTKIIAILSFGAILMSCGNREKDNAPMVQSFELSYSSDTINVIDRYGRKQGVWKTKDCEDTLVYLDNIAHSTHGTTARELIKTLNATRK